MPTIYRPRTDRQRQKALAIAQAKLDSAPPVNVISPPTILRLNTFAPQLAQEIQERGSALSSQSAASAAANPARAVAHMFISHFFQVFNLGVKRGKYPASDRAHYSLDISSEKVPALVTDSDLILWSNNIIAGDVARVDAGGADMENPSAADVGDAMSGLQPLLQALTTAKDAYDGEQEDVAGLREEADDLIADIWDEVLFAFRKDDAPSMRRKAREYGVVYHLSPNENPLPEEYSVQGTVTAAPSNNTGNPPILMDAQVTVEGTTESVLTDETGRYLIPKLTAGNYNLVFSKEGYTTQTIPVTVVDGEIVEINVVMQEEVL